ncbi:MAG: 23S rRNA (uracil(1939)-C(5))-methyltransferase RlmD [Olsenella sp.]|nr:23S rRNA (uracil(1939)-C(5))-methyltransferase RlmD [Olsenella sp.]
MHDQGEKLRLCVERMAYGPEAVAHDDDGKVVFVAGAVPGDVVMARVTQDSPTLCHAVVEEVVEAGPDRVTPSQDLTGLGGACPWAHLSRAGQLQAKRSNVVDTLTRVGHFDHERAEALVTPCEDPGDAWGYRNKVELTVERQGDRLVLGMFDPTVGRAVRIDSCPLLPKRFARLTKSVAGALSYLSTSNKIDLERVGIRVSQRTGDLEVALWGPTGPFPRAHVAKVIGDATKASSVVRVMTKGPMKARRVAGVERLAGAGSWSERMGDEVMRLSAPSFFQVNTKGAERLVQLVMEALNPSEGDEAMDLYCGAGTFTLPLARRAGFVSAVESYGPAVRDLRRNLEVAGLDNVDAVGGDAGREFPDTDADVIVVDPPRAGLAKDVVEQLSAQPARAIAYVSCDPATLARDLARFEEAGTFRPVRVTPVDLFPQTYHVETVTLLERQ